MKQAMATPQCAQNAKGSLRKLASDKGPEPRRSRFKSLTISLVSFVCGTLFGLYVVQWFVHLLPGARAEVNVTGLRSTKGSAAGCTVYMIELGNNDPIEYLYGKIQFPTLIDDYKFGYAAEEVTQRDGNLGVQVSMPGRSPDGKCQITETPFASEIGIQTSAGGRILEFSASKVAPKSEILGAVVVDDDRPEHYPLPAFYSEGAYEYLKLGQTVRKPLPVHFRGTYDASN